MYKDRKETTHEEIGEEQHTSSYIYICVCVCVCVCVYVCENKYNVCKNGHKTGVQEAKRSSKNNKEVNTPPNNMKHKSPLQKHVFLPLTFRILKRNHIFSQFLSWLTNGTRSYKASLKKHKDDQGAQGIHINAWM